MKTVLMILGMVFCLKLIFELIVRLLGICPIDHDTIARQGADKCPKCKKEI